MSYSNSVDEVQSFLSNFDKLIIELKKEDNDEISMLLKYLKEASTRFGIEKVEKLTCELDKIFNLVRENNLKVKPELIALTLITADHVHALLSSAFFVNKPVFTLQECKDVPSAGIAKNIVLNMSKDTAFNNIPDSMRKWCNN